MFLFFWKLPLRIFLREEKQCKCLRDTVKRRSLNMHPHYIYIVHPYKLTNHNSLEDDMHDDMSPTSETTEHMYSKV